MVDTIEQVPESLQAYSVLCEFCARLFAENPTEEFIAQLAENRELLLEEPFSSVAEAPARRLHDLLAAGQGDFEAFVTDIRRDYTYLFYMVGASHTSPFESVYRTDDRTMFGPTTLEVREAYKAHGRQIVNQGSEPDDHIATELSFMAFLLASAAASAVSADAASCTKTMGDAKRFLADHLLVFAPVYLKNVQTRAQEPFFAAAAALAADTLASLSAMLETNASETIDEKTYLLID